MQEVVYHRGSIVLFVGIDGDMIDPRHESGPVDPYQSVDSDGVTE